MYSYRNSLKSDKYDELINLYFIRPIAGLIVRGLYATPVTPNQVTLASIASGLIAAFFYLQGTSEAIVVAGLLITFKDVLDAADGQLARAKNQYSRVGRFLDSIGDILVNFFVFSAIGWVLFQSSGNRWMLILALLGFLGISLRVSYHVFYQVHYLHLQNLYMTNRITEEVRNGDLKKDKLELMFQCIFQFAYGWQDRLMEQADAWSRNHRTGTDLLNQWYSDATGLRISGLLGFGTELFLLMLCSIFHRLELYLYLNIFFMNGILLLCVLYRRFILLNELFVGE
jgi:phosphatidylglycerophosphate synthase